MKIKYCAWCRIKPKFTYYKYVGSGIPAWATVECVNEECPEKPIAHTVFAKPFMVIDEWNAMGPEQRIIL